jgi:hypothetical protein
LGGRHRACSWIIYCELSPQLPQIIKRQALWPACRRLPLKRIGCRAKLTRRQVRSEGKPRAKGTRKAAGKFREFARHEVSGANAVGRSNPALSTTCHRRRYTRKPTTDREKQTKMLLTQPGPQPRPTQEPLIRPGQRPVEDPPDTGPLVPAPPDSAPTPEPPTQPGRAPSEDPQPEPDTIGKRFAVRDGCITA